MRDGALRVARPDRRQVVLGGALLAATAGAAALRPGQGIDRVTGVSLERAVPLRIGPYRFASTTGLIVPSREETGREETNRRIYDEVLARIYIADDTPPMMMLIAYGGAQDADLALHRPEACYPSAGYRLGRTGELPLAGIPGERASALTATRSGREEQLYYWSRIGRRFPSDRFQEKWAVLRANLARETPDGVLVRLSMRSPDREVAMKRMMAFNRMLLDAVAPGGRRLLLGTGAVT
ncbi:EpsI family protein [Sphingomonas gellani]|uniref:EpsI family protein n=1 Tax=Sphingomonas gellani TaxID=1166340 RepID=A0A1H8HYD2_9SPHN|nr:exosortase C-terminal domain/associated protein EpsI [Sphingomonas gellani]SEN61067.1 EpsI family protein [Sphingomonas gellani]